MKKIVKPVVAATCMFLAQFSLAHAGNFDGGYLQASVGYEHNDSSFQGVGTSGANYGLPVTMDGSSTSDNGMVGVGFGMGAYMDANNTLLLGLGVDYQPLRQSGSMQSVSVGGVAQNVSTSVDVKSRYNVFGILGYAFQPDMMAYLKAGYSNENITNGLANASADASGYLVGIGYKQAMTKHWHLLAEINYMHYENTSLGNSASGVSGNVSPKAMDVLIGTEWKF
jgi:outer membrane immunogenic protein